MRPLVVGLALATVLSGCVSGAATTEQTSGTPEPGGPVLPTASDVRTESQDRQSTVETIHEGIVSIVSGEQGSVASEVEIRVGKILSGFDARQERRGTVLTVPEQVLFAYDEARLQPGARKALEKVAEVLAFYRRAPVVVTGHTDSRGSNAYNARLSLRRAEAVRDFLTQQGDVDAGRITVEGAGESEPVAPNKHADGSDNPAGRQQNRRVEILVEGVQR